jgi:hypothetical protein
VEIVLPDLYYWGGIAMFPGILVPIVLFFGLAVVGSLIMSNVER